MATFAATYACANGTAAAAPVWPGRFQGQVSW